MVKKILPLILCLLTLVTCRPKSKPGVEGKGDSDSKAPSVSTMYARFDYVLCYADEAHFGKTRAQLKEANADYTYLNFGNKVTVVAEKKAGDDLYYQFKKPSGEEFWAKSTTLAAQFIVINSSDIPIYSEPDTSYGLKKNLQPGMLGFLLEENNGWYKVEVWAYTREKPKKWAGGTFWIQSGFTNDLETAKQAYLYYQATRSEAKDNDIPKAIELTKQAIDLGNTDIINVLEEYILELEGQ